MREAPTKPKHLPLAKLDEGSPIPLYHQIEIDLRELITNGILTPGDALPPETELAERYGVGRHTMRMALGRLVVDGLLARRAGRGTVVRSQIDRRHFHLDRSFTRQMAEMGMHASSHVLRATDGTIDHNAPAILHHKIGAGCFILERLRFGDHIPIGLQTTVIVTALCPGIGTFDFTALSLYQILADEYNLVVNRIMHTVGAVLADREQAKWLHIQPRDALLLVKTSAYLENGDLIEFTTSYYRADQYEYSTTQVFTPAP